MEVEVLLSCMYQNDTSIIADSNLINTPVLIINQTDTDNEMLITLNDKQRLYNTNTRGLSVSRNIGMLNSRGDICVISDDDEIFVDDMSSKVIQAYHEINDADVIIFKIKNLNKKLGDKCRKLKKYDLLRTSSIQITFLRKSVVGKIYFDTKLGAGTGNGGGEENKFLLDCYKRGLKIYFAPICIAELISNNDSTWFKGYDENYFYNLGKTTRYILGLPVSLFYALYTIISKRKKFIDIPLHRAVSKLFKGIIKNELRKTNK